MPVIQECWDQNWGGEERRIPGDGKPVCLIAGGDQSETLSQKIKKKNSLYGIVVISIRIIDLCFKDKTMATQRG